MEQLKVEYVPIETVLPYSNNARSHGDTDVDAIMASIKEFGFNDPIGVWKDIIVEGHGRLLAAKRLGMETVPVIRLDHLTDEQRKAYGLAHNKTAELSGWDFNVLDAELQDIGSIDMSLFGFDMSSVEAAPEAVEDDYDFSEPPKESKVKKGEIWTLGAHRLMCGDATVFEDVKKLTGGGGWR